MSRRTIPIPILIFIWLAIIGGLFWWWQGRKEPKEARTTEILRESGPAALTETAPLKEKDTLSDERTIADFNQVVAALEMYRDEWGHYPSWLSSVAVYISINTYDPFKDNYWSGTASGSPSYCLWTELEKGGYLIASSCGTKEISRKPASVEECCQLSKE